MDGRVVGVFGSVAAAEAARAELLEAGVPGERAVVSVPLTADDIAAEAPGQSFENQPGQDPRDSASARYGEAVRMGACTLTVDLAPGLERERVEAAMRRHGALRVVQPPSAGGKVAESRDA